MLAFCKVLFISLIFVTPSQKYYVESFKSKVKSANDDENTLMDLRNFQFLMNHKKCTEKKPFLLILISSAPSNVEKRKAIRETWGEKNSVIQVYFLLGISKEYKNNLELENLYFEDLIQGNFIDTYRNLTYKHVMALKWVVNHCSSPSHVLKTDDDIFIHMSALMNYLKTQPYFGIQHYILCTPAVSSRVQRSWRSKWRASSKEYPDKVYPPYCPGWSIIYSVDTVHLLYSAAKSEPFFWIDDVFVTGVLAKKVNVTPMPIRATLTSTRFLKLMIRRGDYPKKIMIGPPNISVNMIRQLHGIVTGRL